MVLLRGAASLLLFLLLGTAAAVAARPMAIELYFSPAELARIAGYGEELVSSVSVSGQVACELCLRPGSDLLTFELPGNSSRALVFPCCGPKARRPRRHGAAGGGGSPPQVFNARLPGWRLLRHAPLAQGSGESRLRHLRRRAAATCPQESLGATDMEGSNSRFTCWRVGSMKRHVPSSASGPPLVMQIVMNDVGQEMVYAS